MNRICLSKRGSSQPKKSAAFVLLVSFCLFSFSFSAQAQQSQRRSAVVRAVETARPSVVNITGQKLVPRDDQFTNEKKRVNGMGTGVVVDPRGYILTNYHVIQDVRRIRVTLATGQAYFARPVAHDPSTDLAIIKIPVNFAMKVVKVGSSRDIMTGETVIAVGNAYGYEHTVTTGIVSAQHRNVQVNDIQSYKDLIQTDASINPGNSGGPLLNIDGDMIGINVAVRVGAQGIGFAIPVDQGMQVAARLMSIERISGVWHGVVHEDKLVDNQPSVVVSKVLPGSPAEQAGILRGDVIRQVAGRQIGRGLDVECALIDTTAGQSVEFAVNRGDQPFDIQVDLTSKARGRQAISVATKPRPRKSLQDAVVTSPAWDVLGVRLAAVNEEEIGKVTDRFRGGLRVRSLKPEGLAESSGMQKGDILVGVHVWETVSSENIRFILDDADLSKEETVPFYVVRDRKTLSGVFEVSSLR